MSKTFMIGQEKKGYSSFIKKILGYLEEDTVSSEVFNELNENQLPEELQLIQIQNEYKNNPYFKAKLDLYISKFIDEKLLDQKENSEEDSELTTFKKSLKKFERKRSLFLKKIMERVRQS